jgi:hypothetical protein
VTVRVCVPTVPREIMNRRYPSFNAPETGVDAPGSLDVMRTSSKLSTGFQYSSVE